VSMPLPNGPAGCPTGPSGSHSSLVPAASAGRGRTGQTDSFYLVETVTTLEGPERRPVAPTATTR
jgi:hypothetical protein